MKKAFLVLEEGLLKKSLIKIEGVMTIGRSPGNPIHFHDLGLSRVHARIVNDGKTCTIEDLRSTNGTFVEGRKIHKTSLRSGMTVQVGSTMLRYFVEGEKEQYLEHLRDTQEILHLEEHEKLEMTRIRPRSKRLREAIGRVPIFQALNTVELEKITDLANLHIYQEGEIILREGDPGRSIYIVLDGEVRVFTNDYRGNRIVLSTLRDDQFFGEIGMLTGRPRMASVVATKESSLLAELPFHRMRELLERYPQIKKVFEEYAKRRLYETYAKKEKAGAIERRRHPRLNAELPVKFSIRPGEGIEERLTEEVYQAVSRDISLSGIRILVKVLSLLSLPLETCLRMEIELPDKHGVLLDLGAIKNRFPNNDMNSVFFSIRFLELSDRSMIRLKEFIYG